ncbi:MAG: hypothetical protein ACTSUE_15010 [Promethearchaeota archaeon]
MIANLDTPFCIRTLLHTLQDARDTIDSRADFTVAEAAGTGDAFSVIDDPGDTSTTNPSLRRQIITFGFTAPFPHGAPVPATGKYPRLDIPYGAVVDFTSAGQENRIRLFRAAMVNGIVTGGNSVIINPLAMEMNPLTGEWHYWFIDEDLAHVACLGRLEDSSLVPVHLVYCLLAVVALPREGWKLVTGHGGVHRHALVRHGQVIIACLQFRGHGKSASFRIDHEVYPRHYPGHSLAPDLTPCLAWCTCRDEGFRSSLS